MNTLRSETRNGVGVITLTRAAEYNTITPELRDDLAAAIDHADADRDVRVILLRAEGPAFCAGYALGGSTRAQAGETSRKRVWDSVADYGMISQYVNVYMKLWYARKPTIAAVHGWCIGGGTDMVLCADLIIAAESASFGYPPSRVWGTPTTAMWVYRMGLERAKRYLLTGDEIPAVEAARIGLILEAVPDKELDARTTALAERMAQVPTNQLQMLKLLCNHTAENMGLATSRLWAHCSTGSRGIHRKASISSLARRRRAFGRRFASATIHSATTARGRGRRRNARSGKLNLM
jgi:enoyl-CoA hydratase